MIYIVFSILVFLFFIGFLVYLLMMQKQRQKQLPKTELKHLCLNEMIKKSTPVSVTKTNNRLVKDKNCLIYLLYIDYKIEEEQQDEFFLPIYVGKTSSLSSLFAKESQNIYLAIEDQKLALPKRYHKIAAYLDKYHLTIDDVKIISLETMSLEWYELRANYLQQYWIKQLKADVYGLN